MARTQANIYLTIWADPDWLEAPADAKLLYYVLLTHPTLNYCGIVDWQEKKLAKMTGLDIPELRQAAWELGQRRLVAIDTETDEALVRSFVRHDGVLKYPNTTKGMVREYGAITSLKLRFLVTVEVRRAIDEHPDWKGVEHAKPVAKQFPEPFDFGSVLVPFEFDSSSANPSANPSDLVVLPLTSTSTSSIEESGTSYEAPAPTKEEEKRASRIKPDWMPPQELIDQIRSEYPDLDLKSEHQDFVDYWRALPGQKALKLDWPATWRRWMRKQGREQSEKARSGYRNQNQIMADERARARQQTAAMQGNALNLIEGAGQ